MLRNARWCLSVGFLLAASAFAAPAEPAAPPSGAPAPTEAEQKAVRVHVIPTAPIDLAGLRRYDPETIEDYAIPTLRAVVAQMQKFPAFRFSLGQVPVLEPLENRAPELWKSLVGLVGEGRLELAGGNYLEFEAACLSGESIVRQCIAGKRFAHEKFGQAPRVCWQLGATAHPWTLPQILRLCEMDSYFLLRGAPNSAFVWEGLDGSKVLAVRPAVGKTPQEAAAAALELYRTGGIAQSCVLVSGTDRGGALTDQELEALNAAFAASAVSMGFSRADAFGPLALQESAKLSTVRGELGFEQPGAYTTLGKLKERNRACENMLLAAEKFAAVASRYQPYPAESLAQAWDLALFNQCRGVLGGRVIPAAEEDALALYGQADELLQPVLDGALRSIMLHIDTAAIENPIVVFNSLSWERDGAVYVASPDPKTTWVVRDTDGAFLRTQAVFDAQSESTNLLFVARKLPPLGYRVYSLVPSPQEVSNPCKAATGALETPGFKVAFDEASGDVTQLEARGLAWQVLAGKANQIQVYEDLGDSDGTLEFSGKSWTLGPVVSLQVIEKGPVRVGLRVRNKLPGEHTTFVREIYVTDGVPWVEFRASIEWNAEKKLVKTAFPVAVAADTSTWGVPYGAVQRPNDGMERPALAWIDQSDGKRGVALLNQSRYGYDVQKDGTVRLSLLRSPTAPAHSDDGGNHLVPYALFPHLGGWQEGAVHRRAQEYNVPPIAVAAPRHSGVLPAQASFFRVTPAGVAITAIKRAEDGDGLALRLVETEGRGVDAELFSHWFLRGAFETNLLETGEKALATEGDLLKLYFRPFEIKTVVLRGWGYAPLR